MAAMVAAIAGRVSESEVGRLWRLAGDVVDCVIPIALTAVIVASMGWILLNPTP